MPRKQEQKSRQRNRNIGTKGIKTERKFDEKVTRNVKKIGRGEEKKLQKKDDKNRPKQAPKKEVATQPRRQKTEKKNVEEKDRHKYLIYLITEILHFTKLKI